MHRFADAIKINDMEAFLSVVFIIIIGFYLAGLLGRWLLRYWITKKLGNMQGFGGGSGGRNAGRTDESRKEGEVRIDRRRASAKRVSSQVGDYVDYEEVKD